MRGRGGFEAVVIRSPAARAALFVLAILWAVAGWWIVAQGQLTLSVDKRSLHPVLLEGAPALFMAGFFLLLSTVTAAALLQSLGARRAWFAGLLFANAVLPAAWLLVF